MHAIPGKCNHANTNKNKKKKVELANHIRLYYFFTGYLLA